jgi:hypothetical protein
VNECRPYDHARRISDHIRALGFVGAEAFEQIEYLGSAKTRDFALVASVKNSEFPRQILRGVRTNVERDLDALVAQRTRILECPEEAGCRGVYSYRQNYIRRFLVVADHRQIDFLIEKAQVGADLGLALELGAERRVAQEGAAGHTGNSANGGAQRVPIPRAELHNRAQGVESSVDIGLTPGLSVSRPQFSEAQEPRLVATVKEIGERPRR